MQVVTVLEDSSDAAAQAKKRRVQSSFADVKVSRANRAFLATLEETGFGLCDALPGAAKRWLGVES